MINGNFERLPDRYLFSETAKRAFEWEARNPGKDLLRLGIGDTTLPIPAVAAEAMADASFELATANGYRGYGSEGGCDFLRDIIAETDYRMQGIRVDKTEIFISDGAKSDCGNVLDVFDRTSVIALCDPVYPAYADAAVISYHAEPQADIKNGVVYLPCTEENGFIPELPAEKVDVVYLCSPNNPTGTAFTREQLRTWVAWANETGAVIVFDGAYEAFIQEKKVPHSIYEIDGAEKCAIELRSFSKTAGFTGVRCGYAVFPHALVREGRKLNEIWQRRQAARFNGVSYIVQRGAEAICTMQGRQQVRTRVAYYLNNAEIIRTGLSKAGLAVYGGINSPYIWLKTPGGVDSWMYFDRLLECCGVLTTPGVGFGSCGEGFLRLSAFGKEADIVRAVERIANEIQ